MRYIKPYLIQRASFANRDKNGIDSILHFDYMGSAEFEWGALPKSLKRIRENFDDYIYLTFKIKDKSIRVFCKSDYKDLIEEYLIGLSERKFRLKEISYFDSYINQEGSLKDDYHFWWDIDNDIMFWIDDSDFETEFRNKIK